MRTRCGERKGGDSERACRRPVDHGGAHESALGDVWDVDAWRSDSASTVPHDYYCLARVGGLDDCDCRPGRRPCCRARLAAKETP